MLKANPVVAVLMLLVALFFTGIAVLGIVMLKRVRGCVRGGEVGGKSEIMGAEGPGEGRSFWRNSGGPG